MQHGKVIALFIVLSILFSGCSPLRKGRTGTGTEASGTPNYGVIINSVISNNITDNGFEIRKGTIELSGTEIEGKFSINARLNSKGDFYCSIRGPLGIELVRILMVGNDLAAIDRINKTVYTGKKDDILRRNGLPGDFMRMLFGDMPSIPPSTYIEGNSPEITFRSGDDEFFREIYICADQMKVCRQKIDAVDSGYSVIMTFGDFISTSGLRYASQIRMEETKKMFHVKLSINDLIPGYSSDIDFNLPSYKREAL